MGFGSFSGPVDRIKSAKSRVESFSVLASRAMGCGPRFVVDLASPFTELLVAEGLFISSEDDMGGFASTGLERRPFNPLSDASLERLGGDWVETVDGPPSRIESAKSVLSERLRLDHRGESGACFNVSYNAWAEKGLVYTSISRIF